MTTYRLKSIDDVVFNVSYDILKHFQTVHTMLEDIDHIDIIPLPEVTSKIFAKVIEFAEKEKDSQWKEDFMKMDDDQLLQVTLASHYLNYTLLFDLCCMTIANQIKRLTPQEIRQRFHIENDLTPEDEQRIIVQYGDNAFE
jgi:S-phase kinase-associated protein 1